MTVKYMGSKRAMLQNGLGELLKQEIKGANRFIDLFAGSGVVSIHIASRFDVQVLAFDLQKYSIVLTEAIVARRGELNWELVWNSWRDRAEVLFNKEQIPDGAKLTKAIVAGYRIWCGNQKLPITRAYGGHYFSPKQAIWIDAFRASLPEQEPERTAALAALIHAGSHCVAAPGHTAQPLQPKRTSIKHIEKAWAFDVLDRTKQALEMLAGQFAKQIGHAKVCDANDAAKKLRKGDLVFIDPPYSSEHYSRFYHVLETIVEGKCDEVSGVGRYPPVEHRPKSKFSLKTESTQALSNLLEEVAKRQARVILTFPDHDCSNGLSGALVRDIASVYFRVEERSVESDFSTLGGTATTDRESAGRNARQKAKELMLVLTPK